MVVIKHGMRTYNLIGIEDIVVKIEQFGSTRSLNVATAATVAMYIWLQQHVLTK